MSEALLVMLFKLFPRAEGGGVLNLVKEEEAEEMVYLMLVGPGCDPTGFKVQGSAVAVEGLYPNLCVTLHSPP